MKVTIIITFITLIIRGSNFEHEKKELSSNNEQSQKLMIVDKVTKLYERYCPNGGAFLQCPYKEGSMCSSLDGTYCG